MWLPLQDYQPTELYIFLSYDFNPKPYVKNKNKKNSLFVASLNIILKFWIY
jgi:hypothetical protein